jgi:hypothetical protein
MFRNVVKRKTHKERSQPYVPLAALGVSSARPPPLPPTPRLCDAQHAAAYGYVRRAVPCPALLGARVEGGGGGLGRGESTR